MSDSSDDEEDAQVIQQLNANRSTWLLPSIQPNQTGAAQRAATYSDSDDGSDHSGGWLPQQRNIDPSLFSDEELLACLGSLDSDRRSQQFTRQQVPELNEYYKKGEKVFNELEHDHGIHVLYHCKYCDRLVPTSTTRCCISRDSMLSARSRVVTTIDCNPVYQLRSILELNWKEILAVHEHALTLKANNSSKIREDFHDSESFLTHLEDRVIFDRKEMVIQLAINMDSFPYFKNGRGSAIPVLIQVIDLKSKTRSSSSNLALASLFGSSGKVPIRHHRHQLSRVKQELERDPIVIDGWKVYCRVKYGAFDFDEIRELYNHIGWAGSYGCFKCRMEGVREFGAQRFPPPSTGNPRAIDRSRQTNIHDSLHSSYGFKSPSSPVNDVLPMDMLLFDGLHLIHEGVCSNLLKGFDDCHSKWRVSSYNSTIPGITVRTPSGWIDVRPLSSQKLSGTEKITHVITTASFLCIHDSFESGEIAQVTFVLILYLTLLRSKHIDDALLVVIKETASALETELLKQLTSKVFTSKLHIDTPSVTMDLTYLEKKSIIVDFPAIPGLTVDLTRLASDFKLPAGDVVKRWTALGRHIVGKCLPISFQRIFSAADSPRAYTALPDQFFEAVVDTVLLTCRSRGDQVSLNRVKISSEMRKTLTRMLDDRRKEMEVPSKNEYYKAAVKDGYVKQGLVREGTCEYYGVDPMSVHEYAVVYPDELVIGRDETNTTLNADNEREEENREIGDSSAVNIAEVYTPRIAKRERMKDYDPKMRRKRGKLEQALESPLEESFPAASTSTGESATSSNVSLVNDTSFVARSIYDPTNGVFPSSPL